MKKLYFWLIALLCSTLAFANTFYLSPTDVEDNSWSAFINKTYTSESSFYYDGAFNRVFFLSAPSTPSSNLNFYSTDGNRMELNFTRGDGSKRVIIAKAESAVTAVPVDGIDYLAGSFGEGNQVAPGEFIVYRGTSNYVSIIGLDHSTEYHFKIFEYNGDNHQTQYLTSSYLEGSQSTLTNPTTQASNITFSEVLGSSMRVSWTNGNGSGRLLIIKEDSAVDIEPEDLTNYPAHSSYFGEPYAEIGSGNYAVYSSSGNSTTITNLQPNKTYHFALFEYNGSNGKIYLKSTSSSNPSGPARASQATNAYPTLNSTQMSFGSIDGSRFAFYVNYNQVGNGEKRIVIAKQGSAVTATPTDGVEYTANSNFGDGQEISTGEFVVYNGSGSISRTLTNLSPNTTYHFKVFEYNGSGASTYYLKTSDSNSQPVLESSQATLTNPTTQASNITFSEVLGSSMRVSWTNGNGSGRLLIIKEDSAVDIEPEDLTNYPAHSSYFGEPYAEIGSGNYAVYSSSGNSTTITNLQPNKTYHFALFEYNGSNGKIYLKSTSSSNPSGPARASQATNAYPTLNSTQMSFGSIDGNRFAFYANYNQIGNGEKRIVIAKQGSAVTATPTDGVEYTANSNFGDGQEISTGEFVVYKGGGSISRTLTNLSPNTTYYFKVFEYNGSGTDTYYLKTSDSNSQPVLESSQATLTNPTTQASNITFSEVLGSSMKVSWTNGNGSGRLLIIKEDSAVDIEPEDLTNYPAHSSYFGEPYAEIGSGNYAVYSSSGNSTTITNLQPNKTYHFALFEYNGSNGKIYLKSTSSSNPSGPARASQATNAYPTLNSTQMSFSSIDGNRFAFYANYNQIGNGEKRIVIAKQGSAVTATPTDGVEYTANSNFGDGQEISTGEFVVYKGGGSISRTLTNLSPNTTYYFKVFEYNGSGTDTYYLKTSDSNSQPVLESSQATLSHPTVQTNNIFINSKTTTSFNVNWTNGDGQGRILVARAYDPVNAEPVDLTNYNAWNNGYGQSYYEIGEGNYVVYAGSGTSVNVGNLQPGTNYHFSLFEYNGSNGRLYLRPAYSFEAETYGERPTVQVSNARFQQVGATSMNVKFNRGSGSARLVIAKKDGPVDAIPTDQTTYTANASFEDGQQLGSGNYVVYNGTGEEFQLTNLDPASTYHFAYYEYSINQEQEYFVTPAHTASQSTASAPSEISNNFSYTRPCQGDITFNWSSGNGSGRLVIVSEGPLNESPVTGTDYNAHFTYGQGDAIGNGFVIYNGSANMTPINGLEAGSFYNVSIYEYNGTKEDPIFNMTALSEDINDISGPQVSCSNIQVSLDENGVATISLEDVAVLPAEECGVMTYSLDMDSFDCSHIGENTVTLSITDENDNTTTCTSIVTVVDDLAPVVVTKDISVQLGENGTVSIEHDALDDGSSDNCNEITFQSSITTFNSSHIGDNVVTLTVTDANNNSSSATALVTVTGSEAPSNDDACNAIPLIVGEISSGNTYTNVGATAQTDEPSGSCWSDSGELNSVWFSFIAPESGNVSINTNISGGSLMSRYITVYNDISNCDNLSLINSEIGCFVQDINSRQALDIITNLTPNHTYLIQIDGINNNVGTFGIEVLNVGCIGPTNLIADSISDTSASISWDAVGNESNWLIKYSSNQNFDPATDGSSQVVNGDSQGTLTGLSPNTTYSVYVQADCGNNDLSGFVGPISFTTGCLGNPSLSVLGTGEFVNTIVSPTQGTPETLYSFKVKYTNEEGLLPPNGAIKVILDYEGNGIYTNTNDRSIFLQEENPNDLNTVDGKIYSGSISALPSGTNWQAIVQAQVGGCLIEMEPMNVPQVLIASDLEIFANDIVFDNPNPDVSSPLQITATIHNRSDLPAENFVVHLKNQFDTTAVYDDITVDYLAPHESTNVVWNIITPSIESWNPMEVFVDFTNVIDETNELNNRALRPFTNGDFNLPGAINVIASASPTVVTLPSPSRRINISGHAYYTDTAVALQDSTVAGATVSFTNPITGQEYQTYTNSRGYFSFTTHSGTQVGNYTGPIEVTDFTLTGETSVNWEVVQGPCLKDLSTRILPTSQSILAGETATGIMRITNSGCEAINESTRLEISHTGGLPILEDVTVPPLAPDAYFDHEFSLTFNDVGTYYITGMADADQIIDEVRENNNLGSSSIRVNPPLPDIIPYSPGQMAPRYICNDIRPTSFVIKNDGYIDTGSFLNSVNIYYDGNLIDTISDLEIQNLGPGRTASVSFNYDYDQLGLYTFTLNCDVPDINGDHVQELREDNNVGNYSMEILECLPNLYVSSTCSDLLVSPTDPSNGSNVTYTATIGNSGRSAANAPIDFNFVLSNGEVISQTYNQDIQPGERVEISSAAIAPASSDGVLLTAVVDPNALINDSDRNNNSTSDKLCYDFEPKPLCTYNFWNKTYYEYESAIIAARVDANHLYRASSVKVKFEVNGPGTNGWIDLGEVTRDNPSVCNSCANTVTLPNRYVFNESGTYTFRITADPDNVYEECDESNNVMIKEVVVANKPDMRILSQHINPTLLNPDPGEAIFFHVSYENIGYPNIDDRMKLKLRINNDDHAVVNNVPGLLKNRTNTIAVPVPFSSEIEGLHVARAIIDSDNEVNDANRLNNEATRSFVVGAAANLKFNQFTASNSTPEIGETIMLEALVANNGELDVDAEINFSYVSSTGDTISIGNKPVSIQLENGPSSSRWATGSPESMNTDQGSQTVSIPWVVQETPVRVLGEIINSSELEFDYNDNFASTQLNNFNVTLSSQNACTSNNELGSLTVVAENGTEPYTYYWYNGEVGDTLEAEPGTYAVIVIDAEGRQAVASGTIEDDESCTAVSCSLAAFSMNIPDSCNPATGAYETTLVVSYENAPSDGFINVNGTDYPITGSPQTFNVVFYSGEVNYTVYFTGETECNNLIIPTGIVLDECTQDCDGIYGGEATIGSSCETEVGTGTIDENCDCIIDEPVSCDAPSFTISTSLDCDTETYMISYNIANMGSATSIELQDNQGGSVVTVQTLGDYAFGPYQIGQEVVITISTGDEDCDSSNYFLETCEVQFDCSSLQANFGDSCDDGDETTENDVVTEDCECAGTPIIVEPEFDCPSLQANIGDSCDDGNEMTENDVITEDCECMGIPIIVEPEFDCPSLQANIGDSCDDGNEMTENDVVTEDCECMGTPIVDPDECVAPTEITIERLSPTSIAISTNVEVWSMYVDIFNNPPSFNSRTKSHWTKLRNTYVNNNVVPNRTYYLWFRTNCPNNELSEYTELYTVEPWSVARGSSNPNATINQIHEQLVNVDVFPNPTSDELNISGINAQQIRIFDSNGTAIFNGRVNNNQLNLRQLQTGVYRLVITDENNREHTVQVIKR